MKLSKLTSAVILLVASNVNAAPITFNFEGTVDRVVGSVLTGTFNENQFFSGSYTFESNTADSGGSSLNGIYEQAVTQLDANIDSYNFGSNGGAADGDLSKNLLSQHTYKFDFDAGVSGSLNGANVVSLAVSAFHFNLTDYTATAFSDDSLPLTPPSLSAFDEASWRLVFSGSSKYVEGSITSLTMVPSIPVPPAVWLFASGLIGLVAVARRKTDV